MAKSHPATPEQMQKLWEMIKSIQTAMLTSDDDGVLRSRPMVAAQKDFDGVLWFFTRVGSHKVSEVEHENRVNISYADSQKQNYVSLSGTALIVTDANVVKAHWNEAMRTWFPKGSDDPDIAIMRVGVTQAEYWDSPSSAMVYLFGYVKAVTTGSPPTLGENEKMSIGQ